MDVSYVLTVLDYGEDRLQQRPEIFRRTSATPQARRSVAACSSSIRAPAACHIDGLDKAGFRSAAIRLCLLGHDLAVKTIQLSEPELIAGLFNEREGLPKCHPVADFEGALSRLRPGHEP